MVGLAAKNLDDAAADRRQMPDSGDSKGMKTSLNSTDVHKTDEIQAGWAKVNKTQKIPSGLLGQASGNRRLMRPTAKVKRPQLIMFTTQLAVMLDSGVVLSDALDAIADQAEDGPFRMIITDVGLAVKNGENFSKALTAYPKVFNSMFISMVRASEASGKMAKMLEVLSGYLDFEAETRKKIKAAMTYPFIMALMAVAATGTLMFFVLPRFTKIYEARGAALPKLTQLLVGFSQKLGDFQIMTAVLTMLALLLAAVYYWSRTVAGRRIIDFIKISTPVLGTMFIDAVVTRSMRIMATMVNTGVSLLDAIEVIQGSCENYYFQRLWLVTGEKVRDGYQLSESIQIAQEGDLFRLAQKARPDRATQPDADMPTVKKQHLVNPRDNKIRPNRTPQSRSDGSGTGGRLFEHGVIQMLRAGEKSGKLGEVSDKISIFYEKKLHNSIASVMAMIEPLMITILGAIIGTIAIALLLPVFRISSVVSH